ncbi:ABC transporter substrate-binding protein [Shinella daejeonensis]|uniref:ABC transporter substrate-binding protein n=1 Tax=Shinella daejeonensis TaxID=659017 RepID=UPI0020C82F7C|nr:ABC transporter substrate-binding protein [Shinella daejeonensis]MCP8894930.1 ABC transporter substrate-binding protein [Shinella daejeonensis]
MKFPSDLRWSPTRRAVLSGAAKLGLAATFAGTAFGGARAETPRKGGTLRLALAGGSSNDTLDPRTFTEPVVRNIAVSICNKLVEILPDGTMAPELAESWETKGGSTWIVTLRKDVTFHNGKTLEAADVIYSINLHRGDESSSGAKGIFSAIKDIRSDSKNQITFELEQPNADFMASFADLHALIVPEGFTDFNNLVGTGGYTLETFQPGLRATVGKNPNYWRSDRAHVDSVEFTVVNDATARVTALRSGAADIVNRMDRKIVKLLANDPNIEIVRSPGGLHWTFVALANAKQTSDNNVRMALKHAFDRQKVLDSVFSGLGSIGNDHPILPSNPYYNADLPQHELDPDKSKFYLEKAGLDQLTLDLFTSDAVYPEALDMAAHFQSSAAGGNVNLNIVRRPADGYWADTWMKVPFCMSVWFTRPIDQTFSLIYKSGAAWNESFWSNERFDKLLAEGQATLDFDKRKEIYGEMQAILHGEGPSVIPVFADYLDAKGSRVRGFEPSVVSDLSGDKVAERVWLAD